MSLSFLVVTTELYEFTTILVSLFKGTVQYLLGVPVTYSWSSPGNFVNSRNDPLGFTCMVAVYIRVGLASIAVVLYIPTVTMEFYEFEDRTPVSLFTW